MFGPIQSREKVPLKDMQQNSLSHNSFNFDNIFVQNVGQYDESTLADRKQLTIILNIHKQLPQRSSPFQQVSAILVSVQNGAELLRYFIQERSMCVRFLETA
jgi:hypothetical protein